MTAALEEFVRAHPNIFILPEVLGGNLLSLLKRLKANVVGIMTNAPVNPEQNIIQTPSGNYPLINFQDIMSKLNPQTGIIISSAKQSPNPIFPMTFNFGNTKIAIPAFALTDEEARAIYDRLTMISILKRYQEDGVIVSGLKDISIGFGRCLSTFINSRYQGVKVQVWDRRNFKMPSYDVDDTAIVMQGPIQYLDNYTITTAQLYREWYPNAPIIISTWKNETTEAFREECKKIGVVLLENDLPAEAGWGHVNYQIESSRQGVEYSKQNTSVKYALKCRTDQRLNRTDFLIYFKNLLKLFPPNGEKLNNRIITLYAAQWIPFYVDDFLYFSTIEDIQKLFDIPFQSDKEGQRFQRIRSRFSFIVRNAPKFLSKLEIKDTRKIRNFGVMLNKFEPSETFILKSFCNKYVYPIEPTKLLQIYWRFLRDYLIVVEKGTILYDWPKYQNDRSHLINTGDSSLWLDIYLNYKDEDE